jgi:kynurenine formamidase
MATYFDLSHDVRDGMVTYPGLPVPRIGAVLTREASRGRYAEGTEFDISSIEMCSNTGTYLDTPFHRYADGHDLSGLPLDRCADLPAVVVDATAIGPAIDATVFGTQLDRLHGAAVLVHTGWDRHWGAAAYLGADHPYLTESAVRALVGAGVALVGIDSLNIDDTVGGERPAHTLLLAAGIPIVEHLTNLGSLPPEGGRFSAVPVKVVGMGTFPVRAYAVVR